MRRVGLAVLLLLVASGCSLWRAAPWQGVQTILMEIVCLSDLAISAKACGSEPVMMLARVTEDAKPGGSVDYLPMTLPVPPHLLDEAMRASPGDHLELRFAGDALEDLSNHGRSPSRWLDTERQARTDFEAERTRLRERATRVQLQQRMRELSRSLSRPAPAESVASAAPTLEFPQAATLWRWSADDE